MTYQDALDAFHAVIAGLTLDVLGETVTFEIGRNLLQGEPTSVQVSPLIYSVFDATPRTLAGGVAQLSYTSLHRACFRLQDPQRAEAQLAALVDALPRAIEVDPTLDSVVRGGAAITNINAGWARIGGVELRILDFQSVITHRESRGGP